MTSKLSKLGTFKAFLVGVEPCNHPGVRSDGFSLSGLHRQLPPPLQGGVHLGYVTRRGGVYRGGDLQKDGHGGGQLLGYVALNGLLNGRHSHRHLAIYRGGSYDASYQGGQLIATAGFDERNRCTIFMNGEENLVCGHTELNLNYGRCYIYAEGQGSPIGFIRSEADFMQAGASALALLFLSPSQVEESAEAARIPGDIWEEIVTRNFHFITELLEEMKSLQKTGDRLTYARQHRNAHHNPGPDTRELEQQKAMHQQRIENLQLHITRNTVFSGDVVRSARAMFVMWKEEYRSSGGYCGSCGDYPINSKYDSLFHS